MFGSKSNQLSIPQKRAKTQLLSLVAILFFLLAIYAIIILSLEKKTNVPVDMPFGWCGFGGEREHPIVLQVTDAGIYWDKELITERELPVRLAKYVANCKTPSVVLAGDDYAKYGQTVAALDEVRKAGIKNVTIESVYRRTGN